MASSASTILKKPFVWALILFAVLTVLVVLLLPAIQGTTEMQVVYGGGTAYAEVNGTRVEVPADQLPPGLPAPDKLNIHTGPFDPPESSLYWQPAQSNLVGPLGAAGEWLQTLRPAAAWTTTERTGGNGVVTYTATLKGGRTPASISLGDDTRELLRFSIRAERRNISWWSVANGTPAEQLSSAIYRPTGRVSLADFTTELALIGLAALALTLL